MGSHVTDRLLKHGHEVTVFDNLSTGRKLFLKSAETSPGFRFIEGDLLDVPSVMRAMEGMEFVYHLAANADVRFGLEHPDKDLLHNTIGTFHVLEAMRANGVKNLAFSSTGSIYGDAAVIPTPENAPFPVQTSLYGASKLAAEGLIQAYCEGYGFRAWIFRFVSLMGARYTHGHVFDFVRSLRKDPSHLKILGNGRQKKSYLHVEDCIAAMELAVERASEKVNVFNLGHEHAIEVNDSVRWLTGELKISPQLDYSGGERGWVGDSPHILLDCRKIRSLGWAPKWSIQESVLDTVRFLQENLSVLESGEA